MAIALDRVGATLNGEPSTREASARHIAQQIVLIAQAMLLVRHAPAAVADAFIATRLADPGSGVGNCGRVYGTLPDAFDHAALIERAFPA